MTLLGLVIVLGALVLSGCALVGAGLWMADRCCQK